MHFVTLGTYVVLCTSSLHHCDLSMENTTMIFVAIVVFCLILLLPLKESQDSVILPVMCIFQEAENQQCQSKAESDPDVAQKSNVS